MVEHLTDSTASVMAYAIGVNTVTIYNHYKPSDLYNISIENDNLKIVRACCIVRQFMLSTCKSLNQSRIRDVKFNNNPSSDLCKSLSLLFDTSSSYSLVQQHVQLEFLQQLVELNSTIDLNFDIYLQTVYSQYGLKIKTNYLKELLIFEDFTDYDSVLQFNDSVLDNPEVLKKFPYRKLINVDVNELTFNILKNDENLLNFVYGRNKDYYLVDEIIQIAPKSDEESINNLFRNCGEGIVAVVDCENTDYTKLVAFFQSLTAIETSLIKEVTLIDNNGSNHESIWDSFKDQVNVPINHTKLGRLLGAKSLVDYGVYIQALNYIMKTNYNVILFSSDSDYITLIQQCKSRFTVIYESSKISSDYLKYLENNGISKFDIILRCNNLDDVLGEIITHRVLSHLNDLNINVYKIIGDVLKDYYIQHQEDRAKILCSNLLEKDINITVKEGVLDFNINTDQS